MNILLLRPVPGNERFGLGPFFRIEPLGMEYIAAALEARGHRVTLADLRFSASVESQMRPLASRIWSASPPCTRSRPTTCSRWRGACARPRRTCRSSSAATRRRRIRNRFSSPDVTAVVLDDGELALPRDLRRARARASRSRPCPVSRCAMAERRASFRPPATPARSRSTRCRCRRAITSNRGGSSTPAWRIARPGSSRPRAAVRSAARSVRSGSCTRARSASGRSTRSARTWRRSAITCSWPTICSGTTRRAASSWRGSCGAAASASGGFSCRAASISWRATRSCSRRGGRSPGDFDIFFGLEAATDDGLDGLHKDATVDQTAAGHRRRARGWATA